MIAFLCLISLNIIVILIVAVLGITISPLHDISMPAVSDFLDASAMSVDDDDVVVLTAGAVGGTIVGVVGGGVGAFGWLIEHDPLTRI